MSPCVLFKAFKPGMESRMSEKLKIALVMGSTRENRLNDRVVKFVRTAVERDHKVEALDPNAMELPMTQQSANFMFNPSAVPKNMVDFNEQMKTFDALIIVSPEYNWSLPPGLTNMLDNIPPTTLVWKPCGAVTYSINYLGGARVSVQLREFIGGLGMLALPVELNIPNAHEIVSPDGVVKDANIKSKLDLLLQHVCWAARALKNHKKNRSPATLGILLNAHFTSLTFLVRLL